MHVFLSVFLSLLPVRYRTAIARWGTISVGNEGAFISGMIEFFLCLCLLIYYYFVFASQVMRGVGGDMLVKASEKGGDTAVKGFGLVVLLMFFTSWITWLFIYFAIEGGIRALAAWVTGEIVPTLPLQVLAFAHGQAEKISGERKLGTRIPDKVQKPGPDGFDLLIASCRPKPDWNYHLNTVCYEDELYDVAEQRSGAPPHHFVYLLRRKHEAALVRVLHHYHPEDVLHQPDGNWNRAKEMVAEAKRRFSDDLRGWRNKT